jgi:hypothetical protein
MNEEANDCSFETASHATRTTFLSLFEFLNGLFVLFALVPTILKNEPSRLKMPQMTNQMNNMSMSTAYPPQQMPQATNQVSMRTPAPMSFAERSQMMQQQSAVSQQYMQTPAPLCQQQQQRDTFLPAGFHRPDPTQMSPEQVPTTYVYSNAEAAGQTNTIAPTTPSAVSSASRLPQSPALSYTVGMHNSIGRYVRPLQIVQPAPFEPSMD